MPEGHKIHFLAREHHDLIGGQVLKVTSPQGRFRADASIPFWPLGSTFL